MLRLKLLPEAREEIAQALDYFDQRSFDQCAQFSEAIAAALLRIRENPSSSIRDDFGMRAHLMTRYHFRIIFDVQDDVLVVVAFVHDRQRPGFWRSRTDWDN